MIKVKTLDEVYELVKSGILLEHIIYEPYIPLICTNFKLINNPWMNKTHGFIKIKN